MARLNYVRADETHVYRTAAEKDLPECHGHNKYKKQVPKGRMLPLWGGLAAGGFATVFFHEDRKTNAEDWSCMVEKGGLTQAAQGPSQACRKLRIAFRSQAPQPARRAR